jgi:predicted ABC-type ATPase
VPQLVIFAGPNGAGKTTFAREYLKEDMRFAFINADEIARKFALETDSQDHADIRAGRLMLDQIDKYVAANVDFAVETTLASLTYARKIPKWRALGYSVSLVYLRLDSAAESIARVARRVLADGHNIPEDVIRRRFAKSETYFETVYKPIVTEWYLWESREGAFTQISSSEEE